MTVKQEIVASTLTANHGNLYKTMRKAGYSHNTAKKPQNLTASKSWPELLEKYLPDTLLTKQHNALLKKKETFVINGEIVEGKQLDSTAVGKGLDLAYKLKSKFPATNVNVSGEVAVVNVMKFKTDSIIEAETVS